MTTDTPILNDHKQNCGSASAEGKPACVMPSDSNFAKGKAEYCLCTMESWAYHK